MNEWPALYSLLTSDNGDNGDNGNAKGSSLPPEAPIVTVVTVVTASKGKDKGITISRLTAALAALERRCPDHIEAIDWQHAVEDGRRFLIQWEDEAERLGWTATDIFGLPEVIPNPYWRRLARIDQLGLIWLLHGRPVTAITADRATIATPSGGSVAFYRLQQRCAAF